MTTDMNISVTSFKKYVKWLTGMALYVMDSISMQHRFLASSSKKTISGVCFTTGHRSQAKLPPTEDRARVRFIWKRKTNIKWAQSYCKGCNRCSTLRLSKLQQRCEFHVRGQIKDTFPIMQNDRFRILEAFPITVTVVCCYLSWLSISLIK